MDLIFSNFANHLVNFLSLTIYNQIVRYTFQTLLELTQLVTVQTINIQRQRYKSTE